MIGVGAVVGDGFQELVQVDGFAEVGRERGPQRHEFPVRDSRETDDRNRRDPWVGKLMAPEFLRGHSRHLHVEKNQARRLARTQKVEGVIAAPRGEHSEALLLDHLSDNLEEIFFVVDDQDGLLPGTRFFGRHRVRLSQEGWIGEPRRTRTYNLEIKSLLLYQLS